ncbi:HAD domain-containing protein [Pseudomonas koreensis]|uniref:HAD domain-containing protein n=1 Tax=Pseudomonas koreensis TaxID=198620 RepID=UPI003D36B341
MIIFLDIDGVLHPLFPRRDRPPSESEPLAYLPRFSAVLRDFPSTKVVISSTWRVRRTLDELRSLFPQDLQAQIIGATPSFPDSRRPGGREAEAMSWLDSHPEHKSWIALDDCAVCWFSMSKLIFCDDGFRSEEDAQLRCVISYELLDS